MASHSLTAVYSEQIFSDKPVVTNVVNLIPVNYVLAGLWWQVTFITFPKKKKSWMIKVLHELQEMFRVVGIPPVQKRQEPLKQTHVCYLGNVFFCLDFF